MSVNNQKNGAPRASSKKEKEKPDGEFSYVPEADELYRYYKDVYGKNAKDAMKDTVGRIAALSGGYSTSYAQSAGQNAYAKEMSKLEEKIPSLYKLALDRFNTERAYRDGLEKEEYERAASEKRYEDAMRQQEYENAYKERAYADAAAEKAEQSRQNAEKEKKPTYDYFDERLFAGLGLLPEEKKTLDDAAYRYMKTGKEKWLEEAASSLGEDKNAGEFFDYVRAQYEEKTGGNGKKSGKEEESGERPKEMTAAQVRTYVTNRDSYADEQVKNAGDPSATRSFALYLKAYMREGYIADPVGEVVSYLDRVVGVPGMGTFGAVDAIGSLVNGGYSEKQSRLFKNLLGIFVDKGCISEKEKKAILDGKGLIA